MRQASGRTSRQALPWQLEWICVILVGLAVWGGLRVREAWIFQDWLNQFGPGLVYMTLTGLLWAGGSLIGLAAILFRPRWARMAVQFFFLAVSVVYWFERLVLTPHTAAMSWALALAMNGLWLSWVVLVLRLPRLRAYFSGGRE